MPVWLGPSWMLRERCGPVRVMPLQSKHSLAAHGPGCIPWNSDLRQRLFQNLPVPKIGKKPKQCCSFRPVNVKMLLESVGEETAGRFWSLHVKVRNSFAHALLQHTAGSVGSGADCPNLRGFCSSRPPIPPSTAPCKWCEWPLHAKIRNSFAHALFQHTAGSVGSGANSPNLRGFCSSQPSIPSLTLPQNPSQKEVTAGASAGDEIQPTSNKIAVLTHTMPIFAFVPACPLQPHENHAVSHCWWHAHADLTGQPPIRAMQAVVRCVGRFGLASGLLGPITDTKHVQVLVPLLSQFYPHGLLIVHSPSACCLLFQPFRPTIVISFLKAHQWLCRYRHTRVMLYVEPLAGGVGHYVACFSSMHAACSTSHSWKPSSVPEIPCSELCCLSLGRVRAAGGMLSHVSPLQLCLRLEWRETILPIQVPVPVTGRCVHAVVQRLLPIDFDRLCLSHAPSNSLISQTCATLDFIGANDLIIATERVLPTTPEPMPTCPDSLLETLLGFGIPAGLARQAATHCNDVNEALDWACSSDRRHTRVHIEDVIDVTTPPEESSGSSVVPAVPAVRVPAAPMSWEQSLVSMPATPARPCFFDDPQGEVEHYFGILANSAGRAIQDDMFWRSMPMYTQYICQRSLEEVVCDSLASLREIRTERFQVEEAGRLPRILGLTTTLPLAVAAEYLHRGCGLPAVFVFDIFQACLASCQHKDLSVGLYMQRSHRFKCRARWWACPTGDPNAGKSPSFSAIADLFTSLLTRHRALFYPVDHCVGVGNNGKIQERLRKNHGVLLLWGPEAKPILDPNYPTGKSIDVGKYLDLTRWLECANGGKFEWGTGSEEKEILKNHGGGDTVPLVFPSTNVNLCLFQQYTLFRKWWAKVEQTHACGFSARILMTPTTRALVDRETGLLDAALLDPLFTKIWLETAQHWGPSVPPEATLETSTSAQNIVRSYYYDINELVDAESWGSAATAALGKMEYHVPSVAMLTALHEFALSGARQRVLPDNAMKCAIRHFDLRVVRGCQVIDTEITDFSRKTTNVGEPLVKSLPLRLLSSCLKDPITLTDVGNHITSLKGSAHAAERIELLNSLARQGLGEVRTGRRLPNSSDGVRAVEFHRFPLTPSISTKLAEIGVSESVWRPSKPNTAGMVVPLVSMASMPSMRGAGKRPAASLWNPFQKLPPMRGAGRGGKGQGRKGRGKAADQDPQEAAGLQDPAAQEEVRRKAGRPSAASTAAKFTQNMDVHLEVQIPDKQAFLQQEKAWAQSLVPTETVAFRHNFLPFAHGFKVSLWCNSCDCCKQQQGWMCTSTFRTASKTLSRAYTSITCHGDFKAVKTWNPLFATAEAALKEFVEKNQHFTTQDLVKVVEKYQPDRPSDKFLQTWGKNHRPRREGDAGRNAFRWVEADWKQMERELGGIDGLDECPDQLKFVAASYEPTATVVVFCNPALLRDTLTRLVNQAYIKLCGDGTFRLTHGEWVLLTIGALTKHYAPAASIYAFRTTFHPLMFALANKESQPTYQFFFNHVVACGTKFASIDLSQACHQYHADLHCGEDLAQKEVFINADRIADWAHVIGACQRAKPATAGLNPVLEARFIAYRSGVLATAKKNLSSAGKATLLAVLERTLYCLRSVPTALIFQVLADLFFRTFLAQSPPERKLVNMLQRWYFVKWSAADARRRFQIEEWPGDPGHIFVADWWCGIERTQPGSASGTQAQESWHRHKLKNYVGIRSSLPTLVQNLGQFTKSRRQDLPESLPDVPHDPFPDKTVLYDSNALTRGGRSSGHQYFRTGAYDVWDDGRGSVFFCMNSTLATWDRVQKDWKLTPDAEVPIPKKGFAQHMAALLTARNTASVTHSLQSLGVQPDPLEDLEACTRFLGRHVLVVVGPYSCQFWRRTGGQDVDGNKHVQGLCSFCQTFCTHGTCEHLHAAFLHLDFISLREAVFPDRDRREPLFQQEPVHMLLPAREVPAQESPAQAPAPPGPNASLHAFLRAHHFQTWEDAIQKQCITVQQLSSLDFLHLRAALPNIPAGVLLNMQKAALDWLDKARKSCINVLKSFCAMSSMS